MEYKEIINEIIDGLNFYNRDYNGTFISNTVIESSKGPYKCFKDIHFSLYHKYLSNNTVVFEINYMAKEIDGSIDRDLKNVKNLICSEVFKIISNKEELQRYGIKQNTNTFR